MKHSQVRRLRPKSRLKLAVQTSLAAYMASLGVGTTVAQEIPNRYVAPNNGYSQQTNSVPINQQPQSGFDPFQNRYQSIPAQSYPNTNQSYADSYGQAITSQQPLSQPYVQPTAPQSFAQPQTVYQQPQAYPSGQLPSEFATPSAPVQGYGPEQVYGVPQGGSQSFVAPSQPLGEPLMPLNSPWSLNPDAGNSLTNPYQPRVRDVPIDVFVQEGQTGRFVLGGSVNTDLGVAGQVIVEERNFDLFKFPRGLGDLFNGAFRGGGQNFRLEAVPGNQVQRYSVDLTEPNLFGYSPYSLSVGGFYFNRIYRDFDEQRLGGRLALGYVVTPNMQISTEVRAEDVEITDPRINGVQILDRALGSNDVYTGRVRLTHNTRDSPFLPTQGHHLELIYDQVFGEFDFPRGQVNFSRYFLLRERADRTGRHTLTTAYRLGFSGADTPIFENFYAGGFSTLRGFRFRGASPVENDVQVGGRFQFLGSLEYMMPVTADDMIRMVGFVDYGTVERDIELNWDNFRVAPGLGLRIAVPALGPAPLAFDFAVPINQADTDQKQVFSFNAGFTR